LSDAKEEKNDKKSMGIVHHASGIRKLQR
jgi:hypothetical protein